MSRATNGDSGLSSAEWRVVEQVRRGRSNAEIAVRLGLSVATVEEHIATALVRLRLSHRRALLTGVGTPDARAHHR